MFRNVESQPDFPAIEREILRFWEMERPFAQLVEKNRKNKKKWSFVDGPITANNPMGVHHAWGRTFKDVFQRHRAMLGYEQRYQNGFDCQGLWVEVEVEKELELDSKREIVDYGLQPFAEKCKARVERFAQRQTEQSIRLGQWMHWDNSYYTLTDNNIQSIWHFLKLCNDKGWLFKGHRSMPWCWRCASSLSQHELADSYQEMTHNAVFFKVPIDGPHKEFFLVWTTTPWTLTANVALAVHPELTYVKVRQGDELLILSKGAMGCLEGEKTVVEEVKGEDLVGLCYSGPVHVGPREALSCRVIPWKEVGEAEGTGIVHIAPGCGAEDFELSKEHELDVLVPIEEDGAFKQEYGDFAGKHCLRAAEEIFEHLRQQGYLYKVEAYTHRYPVCWRCKKELVFRVVDEWFINVDEIRPKMLEAAATVRWIPEYAGKRLVDWLHNMGDWCISRKRFWGLPLPFYPCACGELTIVGSRHELEQMALEGMDGLSELHRPWIDAVKITCPKCQAPVERVAEVGDCWLDAGIVFHSTIDFTDRENWQQWVPADFICEMVEQVRLWFYATLFMGVALDGAAPYKCVMTYESLVDEDGKPFSKTGNMIVLDEAAEKMGADVMRWMFAAAPTDRNLRFGYALGDNASKKLRTLWNSYKFFITYAAIDNPEHLAGRVKPEKRKDIDRWILARLQALIEVSRDRLDNFDSAGMLREVERFISDMSNWYIRRCRKRFWGNTDDKDKQVAYQTLYRVLKSLIGLLAPILPFLTEKIYQNLVRNAEEEAPTSIHLTDYPEVDGALVHDGLIEDMTLVSRICQLGHNIRSSAGIKVRQPLREVLISVESAPMERGIQNFSALIAEELNVKAVKLVSDLASVQVLGVKPNFRALGKKYGAEIPAIQGVLEKIADRDMALRVLAGQTIELEVNGKTLRLEASELEVERTFAAHLAVAEEKDLVVLLSTKLSNELRAEGLIRDLIRHIQDLRKKAGFQVDDRITLRIHFEGDALRLALNKWQDEVQKETLAERWEVVEEPSLVRGESTKQQTIGDGTVTLGVSRLF